jgi:hypothetical protein
MPEKLIKSLKETVTKLKDVPVNDKIEIPSIITRISVFDTPEKANMMRFYSAEDWKKMSEKEREEYMSKEEGRKNIAKEVAIEDKINGAFRDL